MLTRVIINVQNSLAATGAKGAGGLAAQFRSMDADGDGALTSAEFAEGLKNGRIKYGARSAGIADFSTSRAPFEFNESSPASPPSSSNENSQ